MEQIKDYELYYPELRLITEDHKIKYFNAINDNKGKSEIFFATNEVLDKISKDIKFTGVRYILSLVMHNHMLKGVNDMMDFFLKI